MSADSNIPFRSSPTSAVLAEDVAPRGWSSHKHSSFAAYHEPASARNVGPREDFSPEPLAPSTTYSSTSRLLFGLNHAPQALSRRNVSPAPEGTEPARTVTRRRMYDPVRDSVASSSSPAESTTRPTLPAKAAHSHHTPYDRDQKPSLVCHLCNSSHVGADCPLASRSQQSRDIDDSEAIRAQIHRRFSQHERHSSLSVGTTYRLQTDSFARRYPSRDESVGPSEPGYTSHSRAAVHELREEYPTTRNTWEQDGRTSTKRPYAEIDGPARQRLTDHLPPRDANPPTFPDLKGKGKVTPSQSTAFRLDHLLASNPVESPRPATESSRPSYERPVGPSYVSARPGNEPPVFTGKLPPPPDISRAPVTISNISIDSLGISVSPALDLGRFAEIDDFERKVIENPAPVGDGASRSGMHAGPSRVSDPSVNTKRPRKHAPDSHRRKARGLFPNDNVPLAISSNTSKQTRHRPSGDRQPVACGYKDPISQIQCDEPFNRPVELRRHVRAVHVPAEALAVTVGQLSRAQATLLPHDWKPGNDDVLRPACKCGKVFSRLDALRRHWTSVQAEVKDGKCISCPISLGKKKDRFASDQVERANESLQGAAVY